MRPRSAPYVWLSLAIAGSLAAQEVEKAVAPGGAPAAANPYGLAPFHADFPVELSWPNVKGLTFDRTRRQILERLAANLQGNVRREAWLMAMEFFWRAPDDAVEPLVAAMDRAFGNTAMNDVVKNCVEAMGKMANERLESALLRAVEHKHPVVHQSAFASLATCGSPETLRRMFGWFPQMEPRAFGAWVAAVRKRLGADGVVLLREVMAKPLGTNAREEVAKQAMMLPAKDAASILATCWSDAKDEFRAKVAGVLHAAGDTRGTLWLREAFLGEDLVRMGFAIRHAAFGDLGDLRSLVLRASTHARPEIRLEVAKVLRTVEGTDVADVYEVLAMPDEVWEVKSIAVRELTRRGRGEVVRALLDELETATGTRLNMVLQQLAESGDPRAVPVFVARYEKAQPEERRPFLQSLAHNRSDAATDALLKFFAGPETVVARGQSGVYTTMNYLPTLLLNTRGAEDRLLDFFGKLDRADWRRRASLLPTLTGIAADRSDRALQDRFVEPARAILFDRTELPQMRVLALNLLTTRWLSVEDALKLKNESQKDSQAMRALFHDFLLDYF